MPNRNGTPERPGSARALVVWLVVAAALALAALLAGKDRGTPLEAPPEPAQVGRARVPGHGDRRDDAPGDSSSKAGSRPADTNGSAAPLVVRERAGPARFEGEVRARDDRTAVAFAELTFERDGVVSTVRSDAQGQLRLESATPARVRLVSITADGFLPFAPAWGESALTVQLVPGRVLSGTTLWLTRARPYTGLVVDGQGRPVARARIRLYASSSDAALLPLRDVFTSGADGTFAFEAPRDSVLEASTPRLGRGRARLDFAAEIARRVVIALPGQPDTTPRLAIEGRVLGPGGEPLEGATVRAESTRAPFDGPIAMPSATATDAEGRYRLEELDPGHYRVTAAAAELAGQAQDDVVAGTRGVDFTLGTGGRLQVDVRDVRGEPIATYTLSVWQKRGPLLVDLVRTVAAIDPSGHSELRGLPPGPLEVQVEAADWAPSGELAVSIAEEPAPPASLTVVLERGRTLRGRVSDAASKAPLAGARVALERRNQAGDEPLQRAVQTDAQGQFTLPGLRAGRATLFVSADGHHGRALPALDVLPEVDPPPVDVSLRPVGKGETPQVELAGLGLVLAPHEDALAVGAVAPQGGGAEAGIAPGDSIVSVAGKLVTELGFENAIASLRGPENSTVAIGVRRKGAGAAVEVVARRRIVRM